VTNGIIKSAEHRVITNPASPRTSVVTSLMANDEYVIGPADELLSESNPARYKKTMFREFMRLYNKALE
jgi:2'-deoxymugineic-acid 2'-dioxygenase / mugineic-acid 3-dioxygenase